MESVECICGRRRRQRRQIAGSFAGGRQAPAINRLERQSTVVTADGVKRSERTAADSSLKRSNSNGRVVLKASNQNVVAEQSTFDEQLQRRLDDWLISRTAEYGEHVSTGVSYRRRCRQRCAGLQQHSSTSVLRHVSRRRVVGRWTTVRRRCEVVVDRCQSDDVTSGEDRSSTSDVERGPSCLDRAFLADSRTCSVRRGVTKWHPDLSPVAAASVAPRRRTADEQRRAEHDIVTRSLESPLRIPAACDTVGSLHCIT